MRPKDQRRATATVKPIGMANLADVYNFELGGKLRAKHNANGQFASCSLPNGQEVEGWALFRRDHPAKK